MPKLSGAECVQEESGSSPPQQWPCFPREGTPCTLTQEAWEFLPTSSSPPQQKCMLLRLASLHPHLLGLGFHLLPPGLPALSVAQPIHEHSSNCSLRNFLKVQVGLLPPLCKAFQRLPNPQRIKGMLLPWPTIGTGPCPLYPTSTPGLSTCSFYSTLSSLLFLKHLKHVPTSGPLNLLRSSPLLPLHAYTFPSSSSAQVSGVTSSMRASDHLSKAVNRSLKTLFCSSIDQLFGSLVFCLLPTR